MCSYYCSKTSFEIMQVSSTFIFTLTQKRELANDREKIVSDRIINNGTAATNSIITHKPFYQSINTFQPGLCIVM